MGGVNSRLVRCCAWCGYKKEKETFDLPAPDITGSFEAEKLVVKGIDFCIKSNGEDHHTKRFSLMTRKVDPRLVVRRGQAFNLNILLNRPFNFKTDNLFFTLQVSDEQIRSEDTTIKIPLSKDSVHTHKKWGAVYQSQTDSNIIVSLTSPADCIVAAYTIEIKTKVDTEVGVSSSAYFHPLYIYILFNPWCENDNVYMADASHRAEYVENDVGAIFTGSVDAIDRARWDFAQYDEVVLDCAMYLVKKIGMIQGRARGEPIATIRALSAAVNANDYDNGVVVGNWSKDLKDYANGTLPLRWMGSIEILQQYYKTKTPVRYGQCWVFAGVLTSICRALGIPCRPVTCFASAHDSNGNLTIETIIDENGKETPLDSIWNYHVWNEVWMSRPDLEGEYGGWQIADATPQEPSEYIFRCGPAPLAAVYNGETELRYDVPFVFAEVNADVVKWKLNGHDKQLVSIDTVTVGQKISTKAVGSWDREDLTDRYKSPEGSLRDRETLAKALLKSDSEYARYMRNKSFKDVIFEIEKSDNVIIGQDFDVVLRMKNRSTTNSHQVSGILNVNTVTYRGRNGENVKNHGFDVKLRPEEKTRVTLHVTFDDYNKKLLDQASFKIICAANIADIGYDYIGYGTLSLRKADIKIEFDGKSNTLKLKLENPLPIALSNGKFYIRAAELNLEEEDKFDEAIPPGHTAEMVVNISPQRRTVYHIAAKFFFDQLHIADGFYTLFIQ